METLTNAAQALHLNVHSPRKMYVFSLEWSYAPSVRDIFLYEGQFNRLKLGNGVLFSMLGQSPVMASLLQTAKLHFEFPKPLNIARMAALVMFDERRSFAEVREQFEWPGTSLTIVGLDSQAALHTAVERHLEQCTEESVKRGLDTPFGQTDAVLSRAKWIFENHLFVKREPAKREHYWKWIMKPRKRLRVIVLFGDGFMPIRPYILGRLLPHDDVTEMTLNELSNLYHEYRGEDALLIRGELSEAIASPKLCVSANEICAEDRFNWHTICIFFEEPLISLAENEPSQLSELLYRADWLGTTPWGKSAPVWKKGACQLKAEETSGITFETPEFSLMSAPLK